LFCKFANLQIRKLVRTVAPRGEPPAPGQALRRPPRTVRRNLLGAEVSIIVAFRCKENKAP